MVSVSLKMNLKKTLTKLEEIEKRLVDQKTSLTKINNCIEIEIENRFKKLEETLHTKLNETIDKQEKIPCEIKSAKLNQLVETSNKYTASEVESHYA